MTGKRKCGCLGVFVCCCQPSAEVCERKFYLRAQIFLFLKTLGLTHHLFSRKTPLGLQDIPNSDFSKLPEPPVSLSPCHICPFPLQYLLPADPVPFLAHPACFPWILPPRQSTAACLLLPARIPGKFLPSCSFKIPAQPPSLLLLLHTAEPQ